MNDGYSSVVNPVMKNDGDMLNKCRFIVVAKIAMADEFLNITATYFPVEFQHMFCG